MSFSPRTFGQLAREVAEVFSHAELAIVFYELELTGRDPGGSTNRQLRTLALIRAVRESFEPGRQEEVFRELATRVLANPHTRDQRKALFAALAADGYEWSDSLNGVVTSTPGPASLAEAASAFEAELAGHGFDVASVHYRQAVENFSEGNFEACNGQLRSYFEALVKISAERLGQTQSPGVQAALDYMRGSTLDNEEWAVFRALWAGSQDNGPHAGLSDQEESRFRLHTTTAAGRYLIRKVEARRNAGA